MIKLLVLELNEFDAEIKEFDNYTQLLYHMDMISDESYLILKQTNGAVIPGITKLMIIGICERILANQQ